VNKNVKTCMSIEESNICHHYTNCTCLLFQSYIKEMSNVSDVLGLQNCYKFCIKPSNTGTVLGILFNHFIFPSHFIKINITLKGLITLKPIVENLPLKHY